jgi:hypothetical protein
MTTRNQNNVAYGCRMYSGGAFLTSCRVQEVGAEKLFFKVINSDPAKIMIPLREAVAQSVPSASQWFDLFGRRVWVLIVKEIT